MRETRLRENGMSHQFTTETRSHGEERQKESRNIGKQERTKMDFVDLQSICDAAVGNSFFLISSLPAVRIAFTSSPCLRESVVNLPWMWHTKFGNCFSQGLVLPF